MREVGSCPICASTTRTPVCSVPDPIPSNHREFEVVRCLRCGVGYVAKGPEPRELGAYYPTEYGGYGAGRSLSARLLTRINSLLLGQEIGSNLGLPLLEPNPGGHSLLDVGVGGGELARQMVARGWKGYGLDFTPALARSGPVDWIEFVVGDAARTPFCDGSFDLIVASHVLEHLYDPQSAIRECTRLLRPGGRLLVGVPNFDSYPSLVFGRVTYAFLDVPRHLIFFNVQGVVDAVAKSGLRVTDSHTVPFPALLAALLLKIGVKPGSIDHGPARALVNGASLPLDLVTQTDGRGSNIVLIAVKNPPAVTR